jgi:glutamate--cysteine ligase
MLQCDLTAIIEEKAQLTDYFACAAVPRTQWRTGMECEIFPVWTDTLMPIPFYGDRGVEAILKQLAKSYGWNPVYEGQAVIALEKNGYTVTLEPGGQIELSSSPHVFINECVKESMTFVKQLKEITLPMGIDLMSIGYHPLASLDDVDWVPKKRYKAMSEYFLKRGGHLAHHMMKLTTSVQATIDYDSEADFSRKLRLASYLTPVLQAIYAYSPFKRGEFSGFLDFRGHIWEHTDNDRCGLFPLAFSEGFGFEEYTDFLLSMPMIVRFEDQEIIPMQGLPFKDYLQSGPIPMREWNSHVSFAFPEIRLRNYLELRMIDSVPSYLKPTIPALLKGIFYHPATEEKLLDLFSPIPVQEALRAYQEVHVKALQATMGGRPLLDLARETVQLAKKGLAELGAEGMLSVPEEAAILEPLMEQLWEKGMSPAEELLGLWEERDRDIFRLRDRILL